MAAIHQPTRIAFCITDLDPGGAERALVHLVTRLDRQRWEPAVFCLSGPGPLVDRLTAAQIPTTCLGARGRSDVGVVYRLYRELRQFRPEIVQTFLFHANVAGRIAARWAGAAHCVSGIRVAERRARWPLRLDRITNRLVTTNVCVSRSVAEFSATVAGLPRDKLIVIPNGVELESFAAAEPLDLTTFGLPPAVKAIVAVGRLDHQKGLPDLLEAFATLAAKSADVHLLLVGEGPERDHLTRITTDLNLAHRVHFVGWRPDVSRILRSAFCLALPSLWEGMPNVVLEAMAAALPVVATRVEGIEELVVPGETGLIVPASSPSDLATALDALLADPRRAKQMGFAGQERVKSHFSWEKMAENYDALYRRLVGRD